MPNNRNIKSTDKKLKNTALYIRTASQNDRAVENQEIVLQRYADEHGYTNISVYIDNGVSGRTMDRWAFNKLNADIDEGKIERVIVLSLTRVGRNFLNVFNWLHKISSNGIVFISVDDNIEDESALNKVFKVAPFELLQEACKTGA